LNLAKFDTLGHAPAYCIVLKDWQGMEINSCCYFGGHGSKINDIGGGGGGDVEETVIPAPQWNLLSRN
jgi:hypothetical protein